MISKSDFPHLKWSATAFAISLAVGAAAIWISEDFVAKTIKDRQNAQKQLSDARNKLTAVQSDLENMSTYAKEYDSLEKRKIIGSEQRLDWLEDLEKIRKQGYVMDFKYTISPQQPYAPVPAIDSGNYALNISNMSLQFDLLHEAQLLRFLEGLHTQMNGWLLLDRCSLERTGADPGSLDVQIKANCSGGWITLKNRNMP